MNIIIIIQIEINIFNFHYYRCFVIVGNIIINLAFAQIINCIKDQYYYVFPTH